MEIETYGGPARNLLETLGLLRDRVAFVIVTFLRGAQTTSDFIEQARAQGFPVRVLRERFRYDPRVIGALGALIRREAPDILQVHNTKSRLYAWLLRLAMPGVRARPQIYYFHGETWVDAKQRLYNRLDHWLYRRSPYVIAVSRRQQALLAGWGVPPERVTVLYNAISLAPATPHAPGPCRNLLCVGRFSREKGQLILVRAAQQLVARGRRDFTLTLVGDGREWEAVRRYVTAQNLDGVVRLEGHRQDVIPYYRAADLYVLPSLTEGIPNVLLEAALYYVPIVGFDVGGVPEMFEAGREARLLAQHDEAALADAIAEFLDDPAPFQALARAARARIERDFNMERKAGQLLNYYRRVLAAAPGGGAA